MRKIKCVMVVFMLALCGCLYGCFSSSVPSEADGQKVYENIHSQKSAIWQGKSRVKSFHKINGVTQELAGVKCYSMECEAETEYTDDVRFGTTIYKRRGDVEKHKDTLQFMRTERGWKGQDGQLY